MSNKNDDQVKNESSGLIVFITMIAIALSLLGLVVSIR
jgi:hypothetical protein